METTYGKLANNPTRGTRTSPKITYHPSPDEEEEREPRDFFDAMMRDDESVDDMVCDEPNLVFTIQKFLALATAGLLLFGLALGTIIQLAQPIVLMGFPLEGTPIVWVPLALTGGFLSAIAIGLPSFYFYTQLSGLDASFRLVTAQSLRVQARTSTILLGLLPFYIAFSLMPFTGLAASEMCLETVIAVGISLPFIVGFAGLLSIYTSFRRLVKRLPITHPRRGDIMLRLVLCWGAVAVCVAPVAIFRIAEYLSAII